MTTETTTHDRPFTSMRKPMPTHLSLRASQVDSVAIDEIAWFHTSRVTDRDSSEARALIECWIATLDPADQQALALRYEPMPSPPALEEEWQEGFALSLASANRWRPEGFPRAVLERLASDQLEAAVQRHGAGVLRGITRRADWAFKTAVRAYANARGRALSVLPRCAA